MSCTNVRSSLNASVAASWARCSCGRAWSGLICNDRSAIPSIITTATSRFCAPSCRSRSIRLSSAECASRAAARLAVRAVTRFERSERVSRCKQSRGRPADPLRHRGDQPPRDQEVQDADQRHSGSPQPRRHGVRIVDGFARGHLLPVQRDGNRIECTEWKSNGQHRRDESPQTVNRQPGRVAPRRLIGEESAPVPECRIAWHRWVSLQNRASGVRSRSLASQTRPPPEHPHVRRQQQPADDQNRERQQNETDHQQEQGDHGCRTLDEHVPPQPWFSSSLPQHAAPDAAIHYSWLHH